MDTLAEDTPTLCKPTQMSMLRKYDLTPSVLLLLLPIIFFFFVFLIYPLLYIFKESFWINNHLSIEYFKLIVTDESIRKLVVNSFSMALW